MLKLEEILKPAIDKPRHLPERRERQPAAWPRPAEPTAEPTAAPARENQSAGSAMDTAARPTPIFGAEIAAAAEREARTAHSGQKDKTGRPFEEHLARVAGAFSDPGDAAVAWLHDTIGSTGLTAGELAHRGLPRVIITDVEILTLQSVERYGGYIERIGAEGSARAVAVKMAGIRDQLETHPSFVTKDDRQRYRHALKRLRHHTRRRNLKTASIVPENREVADPPP